MKSYQQFCGTAVALDKLGERWTLLILRELMSGPKRYSDLIDTLDGLTTNLLAKRLKDMMQAKLIEKSQGGYQLSALGRDAEPIVLALARFGQNFMTFPPPEDQKRALHWMVLNLKNRYAGGWIGAFLVTSQMHTMRVADKGNGLTTTIETRDHQTPQVSGKGLGRWIMRGEALTDLMRDDLIQIKGDTRAIMEFEAHLTSPPDKIVNN